MGVLDEIRLSQLGLSLVMAKVLAKHLKLCLMLYANLHGFYTTSCTGSMFHFLFRIKAVNTNFWETNNDHPVV